MAKTIDYYFTPASPWAYLGHQRLVDIAKRHGAHINVKPVDFGRIFPVSGRVALASAPQRQSYRMMELERWRPSWAFRSTCSRSSFRRMRRRPRC